MNPAPFPQTNGSEPCASGDPERFFPLQGTNGHILEAVKAECRGCHVRDACLAYALTHKIDGIWAGTTVEQRDKLRRQRNINAQPLTFDDLIPTKPNKVSGDHGTYGGASRHRARNERLCDECLAFTNAKRNETRQRARAKEQLKRQRERAEQVAS